MLEEFLDKKHALFDADYVLVKIDIDNMPNGKAVAGRLRKKPEGGIPWMVMLNGKGEELINSDGPSGNIGYPAEPDEINYFMEMLKATEKRMTLEQMMEIKVALQQAEEERRQQRTRRTEGNSN